MKVNNYLRGTKTLEKKKKTRGKPLSEPCKTMGGPEKLRGENRNSVKKKRSHALV